MFSRNLFGIGRVTSLGFHKLVLSRNFLNKLLVKNVVSLIVLQIKIRVPKTCSFPEANDPFFQETKTCFSRKASLAIAENFHYSDLFLQVFEEMRNTRKVSIWPVAFVGEALVESPVVENGKVVDFIGGFGRYRKFPVDMAGFSVNMEYIIKNPDVTFSYEHAVGMQETNFLEQLGFSLDDLEPLAYQCTEVLVWHTQTRSPIVNYQVPWNGGHV